MRSRSISFFTVLAAIALATIPSPLWAMAIPEEPAGAETIEVVDALNRTVVLTGTPQRIVTAGRAVLMIADALYTFPSAAGHLVGVGRIDQGRGNFLREIDAAYDEKTILQQNVGPEQIAALRPDLVILKTFMRESLGSSLEQIGIPVLYVEFETPGQYQRDLATLGAITGDAARAAELQAFFRDRETEITSVTDELSAGDRPSVLFLYVQPGDNGMSFSVPASTWIQTELVRMAGGEPVWTTDIQGGGWNRVNLEQVLSWNPEVIFLVSYRNDIQSITGELAANPLVGRLQAFEEGRVYPMPVDFYAWDQPDVRWVLGLRWMASKLHPELVSPESMRESVYSFYDRLYEMDRGTTDRVIFSLLQGTID